MSPTDSKVKKLIETDVVAVAILVVQDSSYTFCQVYKENGCRRITRRFLCQFDFQIKLKELTHRIVLNCCDFGFCSMLKCRNDFPLGDISCRKSRN